MEGCGGGATPIGGMVETEWFLCGLQSWRVLANGNRDAFGAISRGLKLEGCGKGQATERGAVSW